MIAPEYFNNHIAVEGEIVVKRVPNDTGSVLVWNSTTKKISTRTVSEIVSDLNVLTTNTNQLITGQKYFVTRGGNYAPTNNALQIYADDGSLPSMTYSKGGSYVGQIMFDEGGFHFRNGDNNNHYGITAGGFKKSNSNDDYFLTGGGSHLSKYRKEDSWFTSQRNFTVGTLISTSIDYSQSQGAAWLLEIKGNVYGNGLPMDCKVQGYIYADTIINAAAYCTNPYFKAITAMNIGGRLCFWFPRMAYWQGFSVRIHDVTGGGDLPTINQVVSIDDVADPGGSKKVDIGIQTLSTQEWINSNAWKVYDNGSFRGINDTSDAPFAFLHSEGSVAKKIMTGGVLASYQYSDVQNLPAQGVFARGAIETGDHFRGTALYSPNLVGGQIIQSNSSQIYFGNPSVAQVYLESGDSNLYHNRTGYGAGIIWDQHNFNPNSYIPTSHPVYNISQNDINNWLGYIGYNDDKIIEPNQTSTQKLRFGFTSWNNNDGYPYADYIHFGGYPDGTGGNQNLIAIKKNGFGLRQWQATWQGVTPYSQYVDYWNTGDFTSTDVQNWKNNAGNIVIVNEQDATSLFAKENKFGWINGAVTGAGGINSWVGNYLSIGGNNNGHKSQLLISKDQMLFRGNHGNEDTAFNEVYHSGNTARFIFGDNGTGTINGYDTAGWTHPVKSGFYRPNGLNDWGSLLMWAEHPQTGNGTYGAGIAFDYAGTDAYLTGTYSDGSKEPNKRIWTSGNLNKNEFVRLDSGNTSIDITGTDLNDLQKTGFFKGSSLGHSPTGTTEWFFITAEYHYTGWASQTATTYGTGVDNAQANRIFKRAFIGGSYWTEWVEVATSANNNENRERNYFWQSPVYIGTMINRVYLPEWTVGDVTIRVNSSYHDGYAIGIIEMQFTYGINTGGVWGFEPRITQEFGNTKQWIYIEPKIYYDSSESKPYINVHKFNPASNPIYIDVTLRSFSNNLADNSVFFKEDATTPILDLRNDAYVDTKLAGKVNIMENAVGLGFTGGNADLAPYISHSTSGVRFLASQDWVNANFASNSNLSNYVTLNTPQTIIHEKTFNNGLGVAGGQAIWLKGYADTAHRVQWFSDDLDGFAVSSGFAVKPYNNTSINWFSVNETNAYVKDNAVWHAGNLNPFKNLIFTGDLNAVVESGIYRQESPSSGYSYTTTLNLNSSDGRQQLTIERGGAGMKFRGTPTGSGNTDWSGWNDVIHSGNITSYINNYGFITQSNLSTQLSGKVNAWENAVAIGFSLGNADSAPYIYHAGAGYRFLATQTWAENSFATLNGANASDTWANSSKGLENNPYIKGKILNSSGNDVYLDSATHGSVMGYINTAGKDLGNPTDDWWFRIKMLHDNINGYYGEIGVKMTGGANSLRYKRFEDGHDGGWIEVWDKSNLSEGSINLWNLAYNYTLSDVLNYNDINGDWTRYYRNDGSSFDRLRMGTGIIDSRVQGNGLGGDGSANLPNSQVSALNHKALPLFHSTSQLGWSSSLIFKGWTDSYKAWKIMGPADNNNTEQDFYLSQTRSDSGQWMPERKIWTSKDFSQSHINAWNNLTNGIILNQEFSYNTGAGLSIVDDQFGGESGLGDTQHKALVAGKIGEYYKYGSIYDGLQGINYHVKKQNIGIGGDADADNKVRVEGCVKATQNFKSEEELADTMFIPNGRLATLRDEIINDEKDKDYAIRLDPHEYNVDSSGYLEVDDRNRLIHILGEQYEMAVNLRDVYPKQQIVIYNLNKSGNPMVLYIQNKPMYKIDPGCFLRLYVTESRRVIAEKQLPCEIIW